MRYISIFFFSIVCILTACSGKNGDKLSGSHHASFVRLDKIVADFPHMNPRHQFAVIDSFSIPFNDYLYLMGAATGDIPASIDSLSHTAAFAMFEPEVDKAFPSTIAIEEQLGRLNANMRSYLPSLPSYSYFGIVSPYRQQIVLVDSVIFVALNHYLGADHEAYVSMPDYIREAKTACRIPLDIAEAILSVEYPYVPDNNPTVIQYIIYEGALLKAVSDLTGVTDINTLMGWTPAQFAQVEERQNAIWHKMAADNIIHSTDMALARRLCAPAPNGQPLAPELPGRIGRYICYRIISSYLDNNPSAALPDMLSPAFYNSPSTLINARYSPK